MLDSLPDKPTMNLGLAKLDLLVVVVRDLYLIEKAWVWIPAPDAWGIIDHLFVGKFYCYFKRGRMNKKSQQMTHFSKIVSDYISIFLENCFCLMEFQSVKTKLWCKWVNFKIVLASGCGSVGRAVASDTRGPRFESRHWHKFIFIKH